MNISNNVLKTGQNRTSFLKFDTLTKTGQKQDQTGLNRSNQDKKILS
jgi:hypothetical protein